MTRFLHYILPFLSTALLLASIFFFIRSYYRCEWISLTTYSPVPRLFTLGSFPGRLDFGTDQETTPPPPVAGFFDTPPPLSLRPRWSHYSSPNPQLPPGVSIHSYYLPQGVPVHHFLGFVWCNHTPTPRPGNFSYSLMIPYPALILLFAILLLYSLRKLSRVRHRKQHSLCLACGYDLRSSKDRCPECGTPVPAKQDTTS